MDYFKINYNKLENIPQIKFHKIILLLLFLLIMLLMLSFKFEVYQKFNCYGIYSNNVLIVRIENTLSDKMKSSQYIKFNNKKTNFNINNYGDYEIVNNELYQEIELIVDENFYDNEVGIVEFYYDKKSVFKYVLDLFK